MEGCDEEALVESVGGAAKWRGKKDARPLIVTAAANGTVREGVRGWWRKG